MESEEDALSGKREWVKYDMCQVNVKGVASLLQLLSINNTSDAHIQRRSGW
jgi:hypothetical protein